MYQDEFFPEWSPEHPVQVRWTDEAPEYMSESGAVARLARITGRTPDAIRSYLVNEGQPMPTVGGVYVLLTLAPDDCRTCGWPGTAVSA